MSLAESNSMTRPTEGKPVGQVTMILVTVALFLALVGVAVATWGLPALTLIAVTAVPCIFVVLVLITVGK